MSAINSLSDITENGLCIGCGICQSIAGNENISISMTEKGRLEPKENKPLNNESSENHIQIAKNAENIKGEIDKLVELSMLSNGSKENESSVSKIFPRTHTIPFHPMLFSYRIQNFQLDLLRLFLIPQPFPEWLL